MDIKILKNCENYKNILIGNNLVLEMVETESEFAGIRKIRYIIFDTENNTRKEMLPYIDKHNLGIIKNVSVSSDYIYFFNCSKIKGDKVHINLLRYNFITEQVESMFAFEDDITIYSVAKRMKVFVLNDFYLIVQHESLKTNKSETYSGFFEFRSFLYNYKEQQFYSIVDENITANGIDDMIPISESQCVMKTGFSLLEDDRYTELEKDEVSVEAVSFVNIGQLISDILIMQKNITIDSIEQAYYNKTIPYVEMKDGYLIYSVVDNIEKSEEIIFYNLTTKETVNCINKNVFRCSDLARHFIIGGEPYICISKDKGTEFVNLKKAKLEFKFGSELKLESVINNVFILSGISEKSLLRKAAPFFEVYGYPQQNVILHEKGECFEYMGCDDKLYLFVK